MIRMNPAHDTKNPAGCSSSNRTTSGFDRYPYIPKTLGEIIDKTLKADVAIAPAPKNEEYDKGYADGWRDAIAKYGVW